MGSDYLKSLDTERKRGVKGRSWLRDVKKQKAGEGIASEKGKPRENVVQETKWKECFKSVHLCQVLSVDCVSWRLNNGIKFNIIKDFNDLKRGFFGVGV
jgi:hypothetical protein